VATTTPGTGNFQWLVNRQPVGINSDLFTYKSSGSDTIACVYTTTGGCVAVVTSNLVVVNTVALPAVICMDDTSVTAGSVVTLYAAVNGNFATALWTSSTVITNATSPSGALSIPASTSTYRLTAYTPEGCSAYDETIVKVNFPPSATNAFSPNGDGINERWRLPIDAGCSSCFISIFDRYGREVFNSKSGNLYWNGELNGKALPAGVYYFTLKRAENKKTETGTVTILR
jgi:gliding motility-associated-like protein